MTFETINFRNLFMSTFEKTNGLVLQDVTSIENNNELVSK